MSRRIIDEKTAKRLLDYSSNNSEPGNGEMNRRSAHNQTDVDIGPKNWLNESLSGLSDLELANVTNWKIGNTTASTEFYI